MSDWAMIGAGNLQHTRLWISTLKDQTYFCIDHAFEIIINALVSSSRFIWIPMLWVYGRSKYFYCHSAGIDFRRQNPSGAETTKPGETSAYYIRILRVGLWDLALWGSLYMSTVDKTGSGLPCCGDLRVFSCCHLAWAGSLCSFRGHPVPPCDATWCDYGQIAR